MVSHSWSFKMQPAGYQQGPYLFGGLLRLLENIYVQYQLGIISEEAWQSRQSMSQFVARCQGFTASMEDYSAAFIDGDFVHFMKEQSETDE